MIHLKSHQLFEIPQLYNKSKHIVLHVRRDEEATARSASIFNQSALLQMNCRNRTLLQLGRVTYYENTLHIGEEGRGVSHKGTDSVEGRVK